MFGRFIIWTAEAAGFERRDLTKMPRDSSLCVDKAKHELKVSLLDVREGLHRMRRGYADRAP